MDLARILSRYAGPIMLHVVNFNGHSALYLRQMSPRRAYHYHAPLYDEDCGAFCRETNSLALITGESIGQVASQTMQSLAATNEVCTIPVFRPLIGEDKQEIVDVALQIGTYETSILPYEDCCTIFVAKHPVTKPNINAIRRSEKKLEENIENLVETAIRTTEKIWVE